MNTTILPSFFNDDSPKYVPYISKKQFYDIITTIFTSFYYVLPLALNWIYNQKVKKTITSTSVNITVDKIKHQATLYFHGHTSTLTNSTAPPVLFLHGDYSHPLTVGHLIGKSETKRPTFSLWIHSVAQEKNYETHKELLRQSIIKITELCLNKELLLMVGHSKGGILAADLAFADPLSRKYRVLTLASRLNALPLDNCASLLRPIVMRIYQQIQNTLNPSEIITPVAPENDLMVPLHALHPIPGKNVQGTHLSVLYNQETAKLVETFTQNSSFFT